MKILHIITTIERGGAEKAVLTLAIAQKERGHEVTVAPLKGELDLLPIFRNHGIHILTHLKDKNPLRQVSLLRKIRDNYEVVHAHLPRAELVARGALKQGLLVITRHNSEQFFPGAPKFLSSRISRSVTKKSTVIAISNAVLVFLARNKELHSTARCSVIYYGYLPTEKKSSKSFEKSRSRLQNSVVNIGTISRLVPQKNLTLLLQLTHNLISRGHNVVTSIVGAGSQEFFLRKWVSDAGIEKSVRFLGKSDRISEFLQELDFFVLTSTYEGFGLVLLEACDNSVPIIASNISAIPEVLGSNHPGLFEVGSLESLLQVFEKLFNSKLLQTRVIREQRGRLELFSISNYVIKHDEVYSSFLKLNSDSRRVQ
jgi:glycosyltransferase involved in cell wall biosynthesis